MTRPQTTEKEAWRLLLFRGGGAELLLLPTSENSYRLPEICTPRWQRTTPHINAAIHLQWSLEAVSLYELPADANNLGDRHYHVAEVIGERTADHSGLHWKLVSIVTEAIFSEPSDYSAVQRCLAGVSSVDSSTHSVPFAKFGWFPDLVRWVQHVIRPRGMHLNHRFLQLNASPAFALLQFETGRRALWFKAVGPPNVHEFLITTILAKRFPDYVPELLATHDTWNGWLTLAAEGKTLFESSEVAEWQQASVALALLQIASVSRTDELLAAGARDLRFHTLQGQCDFFFNLVECLMLQQSKPSPPPLREPALCQLQRDLQQLLLQLKNLDIPNALGHLDCNPGNVVVSPGRCTFLDWAEAAIGNPTFTFQYLLEHFRHTFGTGSPAEGRLIEAYVRGWEGMVGPATIRKAVQLAPALAAFANATSFVARRDKKQIEAPRAAAWLRSLVRRIHREVEHLRSLEIV